MPSIVAPTVRRLSAVAVICSSAFATPTLMAQTAFTYQGQLQLSDSPVNGTADVRFTLYDAVAGGSVVGAPVEIIGASVANGVFTAELDFGALVFDGSPRWIEIEVVTPSVGGGGSYTTLSPRQPINPAPYAMFALNGDSPFAYSGSDAIFNGAGNVGVGTASPTAGKLVVQTATGEYGVMHTDGAVSMGTYVSGTGGWLGTTSGHDLNFFTANSGARMIVKNDGDVGIGNTTPDGRLHISGGPTWTSNGWTKSLTLDAAAAIEMGKGNTWKFGLGSSLNGLYLFKTTVDNTSQAAQYIMGVDANGHVGFNTNGATSGAPLWVSGTATGEWTFYSTSSGQDGFGIVSISSGLNGRGIEGKCATNGLGGTIGVHGNGNYGILGTNNEGAVGIGANGDHGVAGVALTGTQSGGLYGRGDGSNGNGLIAEANVGTAAYGVWGRAAQGIGGYFTGGTYAIVAAGKAKVNTIEIVGGSDLAEPFDVAQFDDEGSMRDIEAGMVVVIDPANPGALKISTAANDRKVAGIISGANDLAPGMVMTSEGGAFVDGDHPVALTGRVWCWCDSATGAIEPGDMLTTSDTAGHAMKAVDLSAAQGAIIGKAMTPLAQGERGLVLVLVNLQ